MSIHSALFNVGIGAGALLGSQTTRPGLRYIGIAGGLPALAGLIPFLNRSCREDEPQTVL